MSTPAQISSANLTLQEAQLVSALRRISVGSTRDCVMEMIEELVEFGLRPGCAEPPQGFPCLRIVVACEPCRRINAAMKALRR
jgi:hypothetical protein